MAYGWTLFWGSYCRPKGISTRTALPYVTTHERPTLHVLGLLVCLSSRKLNLAMYFSLSVCIWPNHRCHVFYHFQLDAVTSLVIQL